MQYAKSFLNAKKHQLKDEKSKVLTASGINPFSVSMEICFITAKLNKCEKFRVPYIMHAESDCELAYYVAEIYNRLSGVGLELD